MTTTKYTTWGDVRGGCGHEHESLDAALACRAADAHDCQRARGYSDRQPVTIPGDIGMRDLYRALARGWRP